MEVNAIIDTACTKTVSGENWFHNFLKRLNDTALSKVKIVPSDKTFKFGDDQKVFFNISSDYSSKTRKLSLTWVEPQVA